MMRNRITKAYYIIQSHITEGNKGRKITLLQLCSFKYFFKITVYIKFQKLSSFHIIFFRKDGILNSQRIGGGFGILSSYIEKSVFQQI